MGRISIADKVIYLIETTSIKHDDVHRKRSKYYREIYRNYVQKEKAKNIHQSTRKHFWEILRDNRITIKGKENGLGVKRLLPFLKYYGISYIIKYDEHFGNDIIIDKKQTLRNHKIKCLKKTIKKNKKLQ